MSGMVEKVVAVTLVLATISVVATGLAGLVSEASADPAAVTCVL